MIQKINDQGNGVMPGRVGGIGRSQKNRTQEREKSDQRTTAQNLRGDCVSHLAGHLHSEVLIQTLDPVTTLLMDSRLHGPSFCFLFGNLLVASVIVTMMGDTPGM